MSKLERIFWTNPPPGSSSSSGCLTPVIGGNGTDFYSGTWFNLSLQFLQKLMSLPLAAGVSGTQFSVLQKTRRNWTQVISPREATPKWSLLQVYAKVNWQQRFSKRIVWETPAHPLSDILYDITQNNQRTLSKTLPEKVFFSTEFDFVVIFVYSILI